MTMITHAAYCSANPLPNLPAPMRIEYATEPRIGIGRVHRISKSEDDIRAKALTTEDYIGALSKTEWRDAWHVATLLNITQDAARSRLVRRAFERLTERRKVENHYEWRLL